MSSLTGEHRLFDDADTGKPQDLSNYKLAQNQTELSNQISDLRAVVEMQGKLIQRMTLALENSSKGKERAVWDD